MNEIYTIFWIFILFSQILVARWRENPLKCCSFFFFFLREREVEVFLGPTCVVFTQFYHFSLAMCISFFIGGMSGDFVLITVLSLSKSQFVSLWWCCNIWWLGTWNGWPSDWSYWKCWLLCARENTCCREFIWKVSVCNLFLVVLFN